MSYDLPNYAIPGLMPVTSPLSEGAPLHVNLPVYYKANELWDGIESIGPTTRDSDAATVKMEFALDSSFESMCLTLASDGSETGTVTITDAETWLFAVPAQELPLDVGLWFWRIHVTGDDAVTWRAHQGTLVIQP